MLEQAPHHPRIPLNTERDVVSQIKIAFANPLPLLIGALIGGLVPIATYTVGHAELGTAGWGSVPGTIVIGGCLFSAITVYKWGRKAFDCAFKALGFVVLSEGVMTFSQTPWLSLLMLCFLVAINAVANGANLASAHLDAERCRASEAALLSPPALTIPAPVVAMPNSNFAAKKPGRKRTTKFKTARTVGRTAASGASLLN